MHDTNLDDEIQRRLAANDRSALALLYDAYAVELLGYLTSVMRSRHDAEDLLQDVFVVIARKHAVVAEADKLRPYLFRLARNAALSRIKVEGRLRARAEVALDWLEPVPTAAGSPERTQAVQIALGELPVAQRTVIVMKFFRARSFREIGETLGISENTAGSRYRYGMDKLRGLLRENRP